MTAALEGVSGHQHAPAALYPQERHGTHDKGKVCQTQRGCLNSRRYPFYRRLGGPQGRARRAENLLPTGIRSRTIQPVVSRYTDWATRPIYELNIYV